MKLIEVHALQVFPPGCVNRDETNRPKTGIYGGFPRAMVSSQSFKKAMRFYCHEQAPSLYGGIRTRDGLVSLLVDRGISVAKAPEVAKEIFSCWSGSSSSKDVSIFVSSQEIDAIVKCILEHATDKKWKFNLKEAIGGVRITDATDIAQFGRFVSGDDDERLLDRDAAISVAPAISTHKVSIETDYFSCMDDISESLGIHAASHLGSTMFNSATLYRCLVMNVDLLRDSKHIGHLPIEDQKKVVDLFLRSIYFASPKAKRTNMGWMPRPSYMLISTGQGQGISLAAAFEKPIETKVEESRDSITDRSFAAMMAQYEKIMKNETRKSVLVPEKTLDEAIKETINNVF